MGVIHKKVPGKYEWEGVDVVTYDKPTVRGVSKRVLIGTEYHDIAEGDVIYIGPDEQHELRAGPDEPLGFICVAPKP